MPVEVFRSIGIQDHREFVLHLQSRLLSEEFPSRNTVLDRILSPSTVLSAGEQVPIVHTEETNSSLR